MAASSQSGQSHSHGASYYVKVWAILLVLFVISVCGPMLEIRAVTLITAFGIAVVKALIVASEFMHLRGEKKYIHYMLWTMLFIMLIFYFGTAPDVGTAGGSNWIRIPAEGATAIPAHGGHP